MPIPDDKTKKVRTLCGLFLYKENHAIVAWFEKGSADDYKANKIQANNVFVRKAPSGRVAKRTEGIEMNAFPRGGRGTTFGGG